MIGKDFGQMTALQYRVRALTRQVGAFQSGEQYIKMEREYKALLRRHDREVKKYKAELEKAHRETVRVRELSWEATDDMEREYQAEIKKLLTRIRHLEERNMELERQRDAAKDALRERTRAYYTAAAELEEARGMIRKLTAQVDQDFENSSIPSSLQKPGRKRIPNSRVATGRRPGGQPGHEGHRRKVHVPTETHRIPAPNKYTDSPDFYRTGRIIRKQKVMIRIGIRVIEYTAEEYRDRRSGARAHAPFPAGYVNEVNYDGTVKALAFLLSNECGVSHGKIRKLISELTNGEVEISDGMVDRLCRDFSIRTEAEKKAIIRELMASPVMNVDFTNASVNGESRQVLVLASPSTGAALYIGREKKGHEGIKGTPLEGYVGTVVHDHDTTFYRYGTGHQECMQHNIRYLIGSCQNEPERAWNEQMLALLREMLHYRNGLAEDEDPDPATVAGLEERYDRILDAARVEYEDVPPSDYYREGYNLFSRLVAYKEHELRFLHDKRVPADNSLCERLARVYKRKQKQAITLRSQDNLCYICDGLSVVHLLRRDGGNVFQRVAAIYERERPPKKKEKEPDADG